MKKLIPILAGLFLLAGCSQQAEFRLGYVESEEVDVAAKIPGRILSVFVREGDYVDAGTEMVSLDSETLQAKVEQARAGVQAARSRLNMALTGARTEEKEMVRRQLNMAGANLEIVERTYKRILKVYAEGGVSTQEKETAEFRWTVAREQYEKARAYHEMVQNGAREGEIEMLRAGLKAAEEKLREARSYLDELTVKAPAAGLVKQVNSQAGEIITAGFPIVSLLDRKQYVIFNLREDEFLGLKKGDAIEVEFPALDKRASLEVYYIAPLADFAKYESTQEKGSWDVKTFEVRARIPAEIKDLRPGMTAKIYR